MLTRRSILASPLGLGACATDQAEPTGEREPTPEELLHRAISAAGGERALSAARVLAWTGHAKVHLDRERSVDIGVDTIVEPFVYARSESWLLSEGRSSSRIMEIDQTGGWVTRNGERTPLPEAQLVHERAEFSIYGLMRLVSLRDPGVELGSISRRLLPCFACQPSDFPPTRGLHARHPRAVPTNLYFENSGRLAGLDNRVPDPETGEPITQVLTFDGAIHGNGVRWPRSILITQIKITSATGIAHDPYFELTLDTFTPRQQR